MQSSPSWRSPLLQPPKSEATADQFLAIQSITASYPPDTHVELILVSSLEFVGI